MPQSRYPEVTIDRAMPSLSLRRLPAFLALSIFSLTAIAFVACGTSETAAPAERVVETSRIFTIDDLRSAGMKTSKQYDISELPGSLDAWYGFVRDESGPNDIEVRFYPSHADAVTLGDKLANEASGDDALVDEENATWSEGLKDRTRMRGLGSRRSNYADYVIFGNIIMLCQGDEPAQSTAICNFVIKALGGA